MRKNILYYFRSQDSVLNTTTRTLALELNQLGFNIYETHSAQPLRLITDQIQLLHLFLLNGRLTPAEQFLVTVAKWLGIAVTFSFFHESKKNKLSHLIQPDWLTVPQTQELSFYRQWSCRKGVLPLIPEVFKNETAKLKSENLSSAFSSDKTGTLAILHDSFEEILNLKIDTPLYLDARLLLKNHTPSKLRKSWTRFLQNHGKNKPWYLLTCDDSVRETLQDEKLIILLADPKITHLEFTQWLSWTINSHHLIVLNNLQATGFSQTWTSGQNCYVCDENKWSSAVHQIESSSQLWTLVTKLKNREALIPLTNEISRQYTRLIDQKTTLISMPSANI